MKKILLTNILVLLFFYSFSGHLGGYSLSLINHKGQNGLPTDSFKLVLRIYQTNGISAGDPFIFKLYSNANNTFNRDVSVSKKSTVTNSHPAGNCLPEDNPPNGAFFAYYESALIDLSSLNDTMGYYFSTAIFCCSNSVINYNSTFEFTMRLDIPAVGNMSPYRYNSSPEFISKPRHNYCLGIATNQDWSAVDADGDVIKYSFAQMEDGSLTKPFLKVGFTSSSYSVNSQLLGPNPILIHPDYGLLSMHPGFAGGHYIAVKAEEFRGAKKIGETFRLVFVNVLTNCPQSANVSPQISTNNDSTITTIKDTIYLGNTKSYQFKIKDSGLELDSLKLSIKTESGANGYYALDTSYYNWQILDLNNNITNIYKQNFSHKGTKNLNLRFNLMPDTNGLIANKYRFTLLAEDNSCYVSKKDSIVFEITFARIDYIITNPTDVQVRLYDSTHFAVATTHSYGIKYKWQSDFGNGFRDLTNNDVFQGVDKQKLKILKASFKNDLQQLRCITTGFFNADTSSPATIHLLDTCYLKVMDTTFFVHHDTTFLTHIDTIRVSRSDTLSFMIVNKIGPPFISNTVLVYPTSPLNNNELRINLGNYQAFPGYEIKIYNSINTEIKSYPFTKAIWIDDISTWSGVGKYTLKVLDDQQKVVQTKTILID